MGNSETKKVISFFISLTRSFLLTGMSFLLKEYFHSTTVCLKLHSLYFQRITGIKSKDELGADMKKTKISSQ